MKYEYGEPLTQSAKFPDDIKRSDGTIFAHFSQKAKLHRVVACINACAGLSNEELEKIGLGGVAKMLAQSVPTDIASAVREVGQANINVCGNRSTVDGPPLTAEQAAAWEWTGEQPRNLRRGESGLCVPRTPTERPWILNSILRSESEAIYWPLRRRQQPKPDESSNPQNPTLSDIADLLQRILDRMPERSVE